MLDSGSKTAEKKFSRAIIQTDFLRVETEINSLVTSLAFGTPPQIASESTLLRHLQRLLEPALGLRIVRSIPDHEVLRVDAKKHDAVVRPILLVGPSNHNIERNALTEHELDTLIAMLNATTAARATVDARVMENVNKWIVPQISEDGSIDFNAMAARGANLAVDVTPSDHAAIYLRNPETPETLELIAYEPSGKFSLPRKALNQRSAVDALIMRSLESHRAIQQVHGGVTHCVTPIPGPLASPQAPAIGALLIGRGGSHDFSSYDLALARNICLRLAILNSTAAAGSIAQAIAHLRSRPLAASLGTLSEANDGPTSTDLPPDVRLGLARIPIALEPIARSTNSHSVTIRLALADPEAPEPHGLSLRRVAAFPPKRMSDPDPVLQQLRDGGLNWRTVLSGRFTYAPEVSKEEDYRKTLDDTESELTVPIRVEGRLVGTINLESRTSNNYGPFLPQVQALSSAIGRSFADAAAYLSQPVLERASEILDTAHDYQGQLTALKDRASSLKLDKEDLDEIMRYIADCIALIEKTTRKGPEREERLDSATITQVLSAALERKAVPALRLPDSSEIPELQHKLDGDRARLVFAATRNILSNLKDHSGQPGIASRGATGPLRAVKLGSCTWDNRRYAAVNFENSSGTYLPESLAHQVYRIPIRRPDGSLRLGAYLAAVRLGQIGGVIHFSMSRRGQRARTVMMVPTIDLP